MLKVSQFHSRGFIDRQQGSKEAQALEELTNARETTKVCD